MKSKKRRTARLLSVLIMLTVFAAVAAMPEQTYAAMAKKAKAKYSVSVHNINSNTVMKKGTKLKISYTATKKTGGIVKSAKVKFKSSNKKVATVTKSGVIKAKKKGTAYITVYCKAKPGKKKKIKIRVGTPVSSISISGYRYLRKGKSNTLKASCNSGATNKNVSWWSDNSAVATVNSSGKITGKGNGVCTVYAKAKDGSGVIGSRTVYVHQYTAGEAKWIAHRGLHTSATENTAAAFTAAGQAGGFWGCECDIWETRAVSPEMPALPAMPEEDPDEGDPDNNADNGSAVNAGAVAAADATAASDSAAEAAIAASEDPDDSGDTPAEEPWEPDQTKLTEWKSAVSSWPAAGAVSIIDCTDDVVSTWDDYCEYSQELSDEQKSLIRKAMVGEDGADLLEKLFAAYKHVREYESIDLVINHDSTFSRTMGSSNSVRSMSADEIRAQLPNVCFLKEYLTICRDYGMVPVIEFKDSSMSEEAVKKAIDTVYDMDGTGELLRKSVLISFYEGRLRAAKDYAEQKLLTSQNVPETYYLVSSDAGSCTALAADYGFTGISVKESLLTAGIYNTARSTYGLKVGTWTYANSLADDEYLYKHIVSGGYDLEFATMDYKPF